MNQNKPIESYGEIARSIRMWARARSFYNSLAIKYKARNKSISGSSNWIRFPFYHYVYRDEQAGFIKQLKYMKNFGDFLSLDSAIEMIASGDKIDGRFFSITFDDGVDSCYDYAFPILAAQNIPAAFFIVPEFMGNGFGKENRLVRNMPGLKIKGRYFTWDECREMIAGGMTMGSHTCNHAKLIQLNDVDAYEQMRRSKDIIENRLAGYECKHFTCPWGRPGIDFQDGKHNIFAREIGYKSFLTVQRGAMAQGDSPFFVKRDFFNAHEDVSMLKYRFGV